MKGTLEDQLNPLSRVSAAFALQAHSEPAGTVAPSHSEGPHLWQQAHQLHNEAYPCGLGVAALHH